MAPRTTSDDMYSEEDNYSLPARVGTSVRNIQKAPLTRPGREEAPPQKRHPHWLLFIGLAIFIMLIGWTGLNALGSFIHDRQNDIAYGFPRTYQIDANVGHFGRMSHFICLNLDGEIEVIELQQGHPEASKVYVILVLPADQDHVPVTISFQDINGDGKVDALVHVGSTEIPLYNNGTSFQPQPSK